MAQEKTTTMADGNVSKVTALPEGCTLALFDSSGGVSKIDAQKFMELVRGSIQIGGRNLIKNSGVTKSTSAYRIGSYAYGDDAPGIGEILKVTVRGDIAEGRRIVVFNGEGNGNDGVAYLKKVAEGIYQGNLSIQIIRSGITVYQEPKEATSVSTIKCVKVERGNIATDWSPAPEDLIGGGNLLVCKELQNLTFAPVPKAASAKRSHRRPLPQRNRILSNLILN